MKDDFYSFANLDNFSKKKLPRDNIFLKVEINRNCAVRGYQSFFFEMTIHNS